MTAPEPKPCPFCLGKAEVFYIANHDGGLARCADADCLGNRAYGNLSAWNLRAVQPAQVQPDPRDEVIARLAQALELSANRLNRCAVDYVTDSRKFVRTSEWVEEARAALAAAKAVRHG